MHIHWFRQDLRLADNPALFHGHQDKILPVFILDDINSEQFKNGAASRWWLHHSLKSLNESLHGKLRFFKGDARKILLELLWQTGAKSIAWNRCYEPWRINRDKEIKAELRQQGAEVSTHNGSLLFEPWEVRKNDDSPYKVFTPFYRRGCLELPPPRELLPKIDIKLATVEVESESLDDLELLPKIRWDKQLQPHWNIGEAGALQQLQEFLDNGLSNYKEGRDFPANPNVSRLSPYLHFGEISPNQVWNAVRKRGDDKNVDHFCSELGWREFSYNLLYHFPELPYKNLQPKFNAFPWQNDNVVITAWKRGQTGYPIVDAGMRQLWQTGYMHNRVRMIVGSFLVKNLLIDWREGERWFWDCLVDADLANNSASWQWVAGCGADAAPYFRVFNPILQGQKFDKNGEYTRHFVPELANLPDKYLFCPWEAPTEVLSKAGIRLGEDYPQPIVDIKESRERALAAFSCL